MVSLKTEIVIEGKFWFENLKKKKKLKWSTKRQSSYVNRDSCIANSNHRVWSTDISFDVKSVRYEDSSA